MWLLGGSSHESSLANPGETKPIYQPRNLSGMILQVASKKKGIHWDLLGFIGMHMIVLLVWGCKWG